MKNGRSSGAMYEVYPLGHPRAGRRRFRRVGLSLAKGLAKTELAAWIAAAELAPNSPVRTIGWDEDGNPIGGPVTDPYIPMVAYTEEQSDELAYGALKTILEESPIAHLSTSGSSGSPGEPERGEPCLCPAARAPETAPGRHSPYSTKLTGGSCRG